MKLAVLLAEEELKQNLQQVSASPRRRVRAEPEKPVEQSRVRWPLVVLAFLLTGYAVYRFAGQEWEKLTKTGPVLEALKSEGVLEAMFESRSRPVPSPRELALESTRIQEDADGRIVQITGPSPEAVLLAYCNTRETDRYKPVELAPALPARGTTRIGIFEDNRDLGRLYAIQIRRDFRSRRWTTGNGRHPVTIFPADQLRLGQPRVRLEPLTALRQPFGPGEPRSPRSAG